MIPITDDPGASEARCSPARRALAAAGLLGLATALAGTAAAQGPAPGTAQVKVVIEFRQQGRQSQQAVQGSGGVIVRQQGGSARARGWGGVGAEDTTTKTTRSAGIFVVVQDGGSGTMMVANEVPYPQIAYFYDYATGRGYVAQGVAWQRLGTGLSVRPTLLPQGQIKVRIAPWLSYIAAGGGGSIELVEAATEMIVPNGARVQLGGASTGLHSITRRILGYREEQASGETAILLTATRQ